MSRNFAGYRVAVLDCETDPFSLDDATANVFGAPFAWGFYSRDADGFEVYREVWTADPDTSESGVADMMQWIADQDQSYLIYVHNGGRFDFHFLWDWVDNPLFVIDARLVEFGYGGQTRLPGRAKPHDKHVFRDSFSIIPVALDKYKKTKVDYALFARNLRNKPKNRRIISDYLRDDCTDLFELVSAFVTRFRYDIPRSKNGWTVPLTVGQTAIREFSKWHNFETLSARQDALFRPYYHGGRVQCFGSGVLPGPWQVFDVNSSYPAAMALYRHPTGAAFEHVSKPPSLEHGACWFARIDATNHQAVPIKTADGTDFNTGRGIFHTCSHELVPAILAGMIQIHEWQDVAVPLRTTSFAEFVNFWFAEKSAAKARGDRAHELFAKFMLNSCYGKFGTDPDDFQDWYLSRDLWDDTVDKRAKGWEPRHWIKSDPYCELLSRPSDTFSHSYYNVSIAASITSASRSILLDGLKTAIDPIYCDTDSVICRDFSGDKSETTLGSWKLEATADWCAIAGKKTYCLYNVVNGRIVPIKYASKGGQLDPQTIIDIAQGNTHKRVNIAPSYSVRSKPHYIARTFRATAGDVQPFQWGSNGD